jgi:hypothetical protein
MIHESVAPTRDMTVLPTISVVAAAFAWLMQLNAETIEINGATPWKRLA